MAYRPGEQYDPTQPYQGSHQGDYANSPADAYRPSSQTDPRTGQGQWANGSSYHYSPADAAAHADQVHSSRTASFGAYDYAQQMQAQADSRAPTTYNPQQYAQHTQYNPQAYSAVSRSYSVSQQTYNPAAYVENLQQSGTSIVPLQPGYSPGFSPSTSSVAPPPPTPTPYYAQPAANVSQQAFGVPQAPTSGYAQYSTNGSSYVPALAPARPQYYHSYTQPAPQRASSYAALTPEPALGQSWLSQNRAFSSMAAPQYTQAGTSPALPGLTEDLHSPPTKNDMTMNPYTHDFRNNQTPSPLMSPPSQVYLPPEAVLPAHPPHRTNTLNRHPQSRPLPGPPEPDLDPSYFRGRPAFDRDDEFDDDERQAQEDLYNQVEDAILNAGSPSLIHRHGSERTLDDRPGSNHGSRSLLPQHTRDRSYSNLLDGRPSPVGSISTAIAEEIDDGDAEAAAGLEAMRMAEEQDAAEERLRRSGGSGRRPVSLQPSGSARQHAPVRRRESVQVAASQMQAQQRQQRQNDAGGGEFLEDEGRENYLFDVGSISGGPNVAMSYGPDFGAFAVGNNHDGTGTYSQAASSTGSMRRSQASSDRQEPYNFEDSIHPFPDFLPPARVDAGGTGGLTDPRSIIRRKSYDEGDDEFSFTEDNLVEPFYYPQSSSRPLPPPPSTSEGPTPNLDTLYPGYAGYGYPLNPDHYVLTSQGTWVLRSTSLGNTSNTPHVNQPIRAKTDAEERRIRQAAFRGTFNPITDVSPMTSAVIIDLPSLPTKKFNPAQLGNAHFKRCEEPWALSSVLQWLLQVADPDHMTELRESTIKEALVALFTNKVPTMNIIDAEVLSTCVVTEMYATKTLVATEDWVKLSPGNMSGVIFQLTRSGCYSPTLHDHMIPGRCYSHHCQRTLKKVNLQATLVKATEDWIAFYKVKKEDIERVDKKEIERQMVLHEIVQTEDGYMEQLNVVRALYRDSLANANPAVIGPKRVKNFIRDVFGKIEAIKKANEEHLLPQLKYRQNEQGPWIQGFSDIFRQWIRKAKGAYIDYAGGFPAATMLMRQELERNLNFRDFVEKARASSASNKLGWDTYLKAPITRLQRYSLLLSTVEKNMKQDSEEKRTLLIAIEEVKAVTLECDSRVAEMQRKVDLADLSTKLILRPGMQQDVELNLDHLGRELMYRGDLQRTGANRFNWLECHALLFDHYMILAKSVFIQQKGTSGKVEKYDVSRLPIPMDLLVLESISEDAVMKSSYVRGLTSVSAIPNTRTPEPSSRLNRTQTSLSMSNGLNLTTTNSSVNMLQLVNSGPGTIAGPTVTEASKDSDRIMYPMRIKHLGREPYVLFAPTAANRAEWGNKIIDAKTKHAASLLAQNAEPFRLQVIADSAFYYEYPTTYVGSGRNIIIRGTPMDRAIQEVELRFRDTGRPSPICRARVNCATSFTTPYPGKHMVAVGTEFGVYVSEIDNPRGWSKAINMPKVSQIAVMEEFNLLLLIANGALITYHLDVVCATERAGANTTDAGSTRKAPQKLSGSRDVGFFAIGRMKDRSLIFYKKREGLSSTFKVLEPVFQKSTEKKRGMFKRGTTEFFRDFDEFYIPTECSGVNLFSSSLAVSTSKGFEVLTLDKKQPWSVPDFKAPEVANIATHIESQTTLGMLRLSEQEFLLCYEKCAVYVNKHGDVSRSVIMNFVGRARSAALYGAYLVLFDNDFVEIRNAQNGRLKQIIAGKDVKCLDDGGGGTISGGSMNSGVVNGVPGLGAGGRTVKFCTQHPEVERVQIVVELVLNDTLKE